ncbi:MAG: DNA ligase D [Archangiaceae bacterium]|nr:DNA ligase D [Archangiaceae bacterium]
MPAARPPRADDIALQLCEPRETAFTRDGWFFELKLDGFRLLAAREQGRPRLLLRRGSDATAQFPEIAQALEAVPGPDFVLDGELVIQDQRGHPIFEQLLKRSTLKHPREIEALRREKPAVYFAFDLLVLDGRDLRKLPLRERKALLAQVIGTAGRVRVLDHVEREGEALLAAVEQQGLEGVVAKRADSRYLGGRSADWLKVAFRPAGDFAVIGWAADLGALHLAVSDGQGGWVYAGKVGSGLNARKLKPVLATLERNEVKRPVARGEMTLAEPDDRWTRPELCAEVRYKAWPAGRLLREPTFVRFRDDKRATECGPPAGVSLPSASAQVLPVPQVPLSNPQKVLWPDDGLTKQDLYDYYRAVSPWLLPYLKDRPLMLTRYPDGIAGKNFFQRALPKSPPSWVHFVDTTGPHGPVQQIVCDDLRTLEWLANLATIPLHLPAGRLANLELADWCVIDFDPKKAPFKDVVTLALSLRALCDELGLPTYPKTTGSSGLHVMIPLGATVPHSAAITLAELLGSMLVKQHPQLATMERMVEKRAGKVYVDCWQNGKLIAAPLCVRPVPGAAVSMPLTWDEVTYALGPRDFTLRNALPRLEKLGDPMARLLGPAAPLQRALEKLAAKMG